MLHILLTAARIALRTKIAADQRAERRQKEAKEAEYERLEAAREASDPAYKLAKEKAQLRISAARRKEANFRTVQTSMFWLSFMSFLLASCGGGLFWLWHTWIMFGVIWIVMCFIPKHYS